MTAASLDYLVRGGQQRFRDGKPERLGGFEVDDQFDLCHPLDGQVGRLLALENAAGVNAGQMMSTGNVGSVAYKATGFGKTAVVKDGWKTRASHKCGEAVSFPKKYGIIDNENS
jgi:hypothetical protein